MIFETDRLLVREWTLDDVEAIYEIYRNPEVVQFLGATPKTTDSVEEAKSDLEQWLLAKAKQSEGHDEWAIVRKEDQKVIGNIMCKSIPNNEKKPSTELETYIFYCTGHCINFCHCEKNGRGKMGSSSEF